MSGIPAQLGMSDWLMDGVRGKYGSVGRHGQPSTRSQYTDVVHLIEDYCNGEVPSWDPIKGCPCSHCGKEYNSSTTHNCRVCGLVFCSLCTGKYHLPPQFKKKKKVGPARVCFGCRDKALKFRLQCNTDFISPRRRTRVNMVQSGTRKFFIPPTEWAHSGAYPFCFGCDIELGHEFYCRLCGEMFCKDCTHKMENVPAEYKKKGKPGAARVCLECRYHVAGGTRILPRAPTHIADDFPVQSRSPVAIAANGLALRSPTDKPIQYVDDKTSGLNASGVETLIGGGSPDAASPSNAAGGANANTRLVNGANNNRAAQKKVPQRSATSTSVLGRAASKSSAAFTFSKRRMSTKSSNSSYTPRGSNDSGVGPMMHHQQAASPKDIHNGVLHQNPLAMGASKTPQPSRRQTPVHQRNRTSIGLASKMASVVASSPASPPHQPQYHHDDSQQATFDREKYAQIAGGSSSLGARHDMVTLPSMNTRAQPQFVIPSRKQSHSTILKENNTLTIYGQSHPDAALEPVVTLSFAQPPTAGGGPSQAQQQAPVPPPRLIDVHDRLVAERPEYRDVDVKYFMLNQQIYVGHWPFFICPLHMKLSPTSIANRHNSVNSVSFMSDSSVGGSEPPQLVIHPFIPVQKHDAAPTSPASISGVTKVAGPDTLRRFPPPPKRKSVAGPGEKSPEEQAREDEIVSAAIAKARAAVLSNHGHGHGHGHGGGDQSHDAMHHTQPPAGRQVPGDSVHARAMARGGGYRESDLPERSASTPLAGAAAAAYAAIHDYDPFSDTDGDEHNAQHHPASAVASKRQVMRKSPRGELRPPQPNGRAPGTPDEDENEDGDDEDDNADNARSNRRKPRVPYSKGTLRDPLADTTRSPKYIDDGNRPIHHRTDEYSEEDDDSDDEANRPAPPVAPTPPPPEEEHKRDGRNAARRSNGALMYGELTIVNDDDDDNPPPPPPAETAPRLSVAETMTRVRLPASAISPASSPVVVTTKKVVDADRPLAVAATNSQHDDPFVTNFRPPAVSGQLRRRTSLQSASQSSGHSSMAALSPPVTTLTGEETDEEEISPAQARRYVKQRKERKRKSRRQRYARDDGPQ